MIDLKVTETGGHEALVTRTGFLRSEDLGLRSKSSGSQGPQVTRD